MRGRDVDTKEELINCIQLCMSTADRWPHKENLTCSRFTMLLGFAYTSKKNNAYSISKPISLWVLDWCKVFYYFSLHSRSVHRQYFHSVCGLWNTLLSWLWYMLDIVQWSVVCISWGWYVIYQDGDMWLERIFKTIKSSTIVCFLFLCWVSYCITRLKYSRNETLRHHKWLLWELSAIVTKSLPVLCLSKQPAEKLSK